MKVALTGATGFVGSHILPELREHDHEVTALVRDEAQSDTVAARGATPAIVNLLRQTNRHAAEDGRCGDPHRQARATQRAQTSMPPSPTWRSTRSFITR